MQADFGDISSTVYLGCVQRMSALSSPLYHAARGGLGLAVMVEERAGESTKTRPMSLRAALWVF